MNIADARLKTDDELKKQMGELYKEEMNLRFQQANGQLKNTAKMRTVRRDIARIRTVMSERRLGIVPVNDDTEAKPAKAKKAAPKKETKGKETKAAAKKADEKKKPAKKPAAKKKASK
jgi:large subunit ribosomal protein L29